MEPKTTSAVTKGIVISLLLVVISLIISFSGLQENPVLQYLATAILIVGIIWAIANFAKQINYNATFGKYFVHGFVVTVIITCVMIIFTVLNLIFDPSIKEMALQKAQEQINKNPAINDEQATQALEMTKKFFLPMALAGTLFVYLFFGTIFSLVTAAIIKKNPQPLFEDSTFSDVKPIE